MEENDTSEKAPEPARPARPRSTPPIIDAKAETSRPLIDWRLAAIALAGGLIGGGLVIGAMVIMPAKNPVEARLRAIETRQVNLADALASLSSQSERAPIPAAPVDLAPILQRLATLEEALASRPATATEAPDTGLVKATARLATALAERDRLGANNATTYAALYADWLHTKAAPVIPAPEASSSFNDTVLKTLSRFVTISDVKDAPKAGSKTMDDGIDSALQNRDGMRALTLWQHLPSDDQTRSSQWAAALKQRVDAEIAADHAIEEALAHLDKTEATP